MLRQLARLTHRIPGLSEGAAALAVYADSTDASVAAAESGFEGVACVDDAARAVDLLVAVWQRTRLAWVRTWAEAVLEFVLAMQNDDGWWVNFISTWDGERNLEGATSKAGGRFWHARGLHAAAIAAVTFDSEVARHAVTRGLRRSIETPAAPDCRSVEIDAALILRSAGPGPTDSIIRDWCEELLACRDGDVLLNWEGERGHPPHLWGHIQEAVLADASVALGEPRYLVAAQQSARAFAIPVIRDRFSLPTVEAYGVASLIAGLERLKETTGNSAYGESADLGRAWFDGRNPGGVMVYDRVHGRVADGVDSGVLNPNSGAESNICGGLALFEGTVALAGSLSPVDMGLTPSPT